MRRFFISSQAVVQDRTRLSGAEFHHLRRVLRLGRGARVSLYDESGAVYHGEVLHMASSYAEVGIMKRVPPEPETYACPLTLAQGILKGRKMDLVIEKATELGAHAIAPVISAFTVARIPDGKWTERSARWQHVARAAAKQSGSLPPEIHPPQSLPEFLHSVPSPSGKLVFSERERARPLRAFAQHAPPFDSLHILIGPEGGFAPGEIAQARAAGFVSISLGGTVLRAETASIAAIALCQFLWRDSHFPPLALNPTTA